MIDWTAHNHGSHTAVDGPGDIFIWILYLSANIVRLVPAVEGP